MPNNPQTERQGFGAAVKEVWLESPLKNFLTLIILGFFAVMIYRHFGRVNKLRANSRYTIGYVYKTHWTVKSGKFADYRFTVNGMAYEGGEKALVDMRLQGGRYVVEFHPPDPSIKVIYYRAPVPDSVVSAPPNGWQTPPFTVPKEVLE